jgi:hypothetical protein
LFLQRASKIFLRKRDLPTNLRDANPAATLAKTTEDNNGKCLTPLVLRAEDPAKFLSSPGMIVRFIAAIVFNDKGPDSFHEYTLRGVFFISPTIL